MKYWWVNHKQTARQEVSGGYLWSPLREANGARSQFYDNMRLAAPGDRVLSFSGGSIRYCGVVQEFASPAFKPDGFGQTGENWSNDGWLLPVTWQAFSEPIRPKDHISSLGPLLPRKYSPIQPSNGNGNQKAYLAEIGKPAFDFIIGLQAASNNVTIELGEEIALQVLDDAIEQNILADPGIDSTTKQQVTQARRGQGLFRVRVFVIEKACRLTAIHNPQLLVASHIRPWRMCTTAAARLDGANGLLLAPHVDRLFDRGLISFQQSGSVMVSPRLDQEDLNRLGLREASERNCGPFSDQQEAHLSFHRERVYLP
jgi:putative restriction endonuclease